jgi:Arc/MetJ-type ribon-helix-helix transcriptional regulator
LTRADNPPVDVSAGLDNFPGRGVWTLGAYVAHNEALRAAQDKFEQERDRRYAEVATEREKALKIKETADLAALGLAREIQTYKDEKANQLREQINAERGLYPTKSELVSAIEKIEETIKPLAVFVTAQQGRAAGGLDMRTLVFALLGAAVAILSILQFVTPK